MNRPVGRHGAARRHQSLARDLPPENPLQAVLGAAATEDVELNLLQVEQVHQPVQGLAHSPPFASTASAAPADTDAPSRNTGTGAPYR
jgi:hypothetical protein